MMNHNRKSFRIMILLLTLCLLFTSCSNGAKPTSYPVTQAEVSSADDSVHTSSGKTETIAKEDFIELLLDTETLAVGVRDTSCGYTWTSLPDDRNETAYAFGVTLCTKNGVYRLNTQDHSVAFGTASYETDDGTLTVRYSLSDNAETAKKSAEELTKDDVYVSFAVVYRLSAQSMRLAVDCDSVICSPGAVLSEISVLPYFGAFTGTDAKDYLFIPDGPGALMHTNTADTATGTVSVSVYGADAYTTQTDTADAILPVFGIGHKNVAMTAILTDADALATITAHRQSESEPARIGADFALTPTSLAENGQTLIAGETYRGRIEICYRFLSGSDVNIMELASAAREELIHQGALSSARYEECHTIPFCLTFTGTDGDKDLTTIQQAIDILSLLKGKRLDSISLRYKGLFDGGIGQKDLYRSDIRQKLGGKDALSSLYAYTSSQNYELLLDINIFSSSKAYSSRFSSRSLGGPAAVFTQENLLAFHENKSDSLSSRIGNDTVEEGKSKSNASLYTAEKSYPMYLMNLAKLPDRFSSFLNGSALDSADGFAVSDAGTCLYSSGNLNRQDTKNLITEQLRAVAAYGKLTVQGGNLYTVYNADRITDMAFDTFYRESDAYEPVPFAQAVYHGYTTYTGSAIDAADPLYRYRMLQAIEFGAFPAFSWVYDSTDIYCYSGYVLSERMEEITQYYEDAAVMLSDLTDDTIVSHQKITKNSDGDTISGVYRTVYSDGTEIYVNYSGSVVTTPDNIVIGAHDYARVKR